MNGKQILVIDDEISIRANVCRVLRMEGYTVREAEDGAAGLASVRAQRPDLILCDLMMPEMDGWQVLTTLRGDPATAAIPFVFLSASAAADSRQTGESLGADAYLVKPFRLAELLRTVAKWLDASATLELRA
ncbi:MAG: response regulator [Betaproteobacteria bacterium]|nr:response regulator [Betaproteobacteria bacterium]